MNYKDFLSGMALIVFFTVCGLDGLLKARNEASILIGFCFLVAGLFLGWICLSTIFHKLKSKNATRR